MAVRRPSRSRPRSSPSAVDGSNVLMHLGGYETLNALRLMVPGLRDRGFLLTSLSDLLN